MAPVSCLPSVSTTGENQHHMMHHAQVLAVASTLHTIAGVLTTYHEQHYNKRPYHTSILIPY